MSELLVVRSLPDQALEPIGDGWTVYGRAVPYGIEQEVTDDGVGRYWEEWEPGVFSRDVDKGGRWVNLFAGHRGDDGDRWLGRCVALEEQEDGLYPSFRLNRSHPQAEAARSGELTGWSIGAKIFRSRQVQRAGRTVILREAAGLNHVAATAHPQYAGAGVLVAREHELVVEATPLRDTHRAALDALRASR